MARPRKLNADWFPHDVNERNKPMVKAIRRKFSHLGYAVWTYLQETLTSSDLFRIKWDDVTVELLAADYDVEPEDLIAIVEYAVKIGLLEIGDGFIFSAEHRNGLKPLLLKRELDSAYPEIAAMAEPITEEQARDILAKFSAEDINRIIAAMDNKGAYRNKSAYSTFASFVAHDIIIKSRKADTGRKYTYNEVIAEVDGGRGAWDDFQFLAMPDGTKYWMRKIDIAAIQA